MIAQLRDKVNAERRRQGLTLEALAQRMGRPAATVRGTLSGQRQSLQVLKEATEALGYYVSLELRPLIDKPLYADKTHEQFRAQLEEIAETLDLTPCEIAETLGLPEQEVSDFLEGQKFSWRVVWTSVDILKIQFSIAPKT
jgi:transcriptional regulator with XRE-family HTH domain